MADFHALTVKSIKKLTPSAVAVTFGIPKELIQTFAFTAGQYITIKKDIKGNELRRAYSISSSPKAADITIGIKKVDRGGFSDYANTKLQAGDVLEEIPEGMALAEMIAIPPNHRWNVSPWSKVMSNTCWVLEMMMNSIAKVSV